MSSEDSLSHNEEIKVTKSQEALEVFLSKSEIKKYVKNKIKMSKHSTLENKNDNIIWNTESGPQCIKQWYSKEKETEKSIVQFMFI